MTWRRNEIHETQVALWEKKTFTRADARESALLFAKAIQAIERRAFETLSTITVSVVVDRALHETKEKFSILEAITSEREGIDFGDLLGGQVTGNRDQLKNALRDLLIELLNVFGNITADILTEPLHRELMTVTGKTSLGVTKKNQGSK